MTDRSTPPVAERRGEYEVSADAARLDLEVIHGFLSTSYWATGIPRETVRRSIEHSLAFGLYHDADGQVGFARVVSDRATFAYLCDVFVVEAHRGRGLSKWLLELVHAHPELQGLRRWMLATRDAHGLYRGLGWTPIPTPETFMQRHFPGRYTAPAPDEGLPCSPLSSQESEEGVRGAQVDPSGAATAPPRR